MEATAAGTAKATSVYACVLQWEYAESCWPHYSWNEHSTALHEGSWMPHTRFVFL